MLFAWLKRLRRKRLLANPFPSDWTQILDAIPHVAALDGDLRPHHQDLTQIFLAEKDFEGCGGLELDDEIRVSIAGLATILILGMTDYVFDNVQSILVYPDAFTAQQKVEIAPDLSLEDESERLGEAHYRGPVILAWAEIEDDIANPWMSQNLVFHEFAHQLDMLNGEADGVPNLPRELREPWAQVMEKEYRRLRKKARRKRDTLIDPYGASAPAEFFAVVTEAFFDAPRDLAIEHPALYELLRQYYGQDPTTRGPDFG
jgi:Mlc titration factor MtfA (ptsG expression regulator)